MRFLMIGISIIIGVILVGVVFSVTTDLTSPRDVEKSAYFELISYEDEGSYTYYITPGTYDKVRSILEQYDILESFLIKNETTEYDRFAIAYIDIDELTKGIEIVYDAGDLESSIYIDDIFKDKSEYYELNDTITLLFIVSETQISSTSAILIALVPLLFATGVILYTYNTALRGREE